MLLLNGCASARVNDQESDRLFRSGDYTGAAEHLKKGLEAEGENGRDLLLFLLDLALAEHQAGRLEESIKTFARADQVSEIKDYTSIATEASTLLISDNIKDYRGEEFETVLISTYQAINYSLLGDFEGAQVEARRVNRKIERLVTEGGRKYQQSAFARYLSGALFEAGGDYNNAYVSYKKTRDLISEGHFFWNTLGRDLWRMATVLGMEDEQERWEKTFVISKEERKTLRDQLRSRKTTGELIVVFQSGDAPIKVPNPQFRSLPQFMPRWNSISHAEVWVSGELKAQTALLENIEKVAIKNLDEKYGGLIAKKIAGIVAKEVLADQIGRQTDNPLLGFAAKVALYAADQADLRSWRFLPQTLQIARLRLPPGPVEVELRPIGGGAPKTKTIQIDANRTTFMSLRIQ
jgi:hypothetical protein